jgi:hypothetical protein
MSARASASCAWVPEILAAEAAEEAAAVAAEEESVAAEEATADPNKLNHIFGNPEHNLDNLVNQFESQSQAYNAIQEAAQAAVDAQGLTGAVQTTVEVAGETVTVRGNVINGIFNIGTAYK